MTTICTNCATGLTNSDDSVWDDATDDERAAIDAAIEALGLVTLTPVDYGGGGYFQCFVCDQIDIGTGYTAEPA